MILIKGGDMKLKQYISTTLLVFMIAGCTGKDKVPPMPPKNDKKEDLKVRTYTEMENKLDSIRNPIGGEKIGEQKRDMSENVDTLLNETNSYKQSISRFEKAQLLALKKTKKHRLYKKSRQAKVEKIKAEKKKKDTIDMVNVYENKLKYY